MKISQIIQSIKDIGSTNAKRDIIAKHKDNAALRQLFYATYDGSVNFWIKADKSWVGTGTNQITESLINNILSILNGRRLTGNAARDYLKAEIDSLEPVEAEIIIRMVNRDLDCKASTSIANDTWPGLIREFPVMLADKFNKKNAAAFYDAETKEGETSHMLVQLKCLTHDWELECVDGIKRKLGVLVSQKIQTAVKSYDFVTNKTVFRNIVDWYDNGMSNDLYTITYEENGEIKTTHELTGDHEVFLSSGIISTVCNLKPNQVLISSFES